MLGVKGSGMSSLAIILKQMGNEVSGSDYPKRLFTEDELEKNNIYVKNFAISNLDRVDLLVVGHNFINSDNIELKHAKILNIKIEEYNECLARLIKDYYSIAVCGSNGKTTTTGLLATILSGVENTTYLIGNSQGQGNKESRFFVFEACEYKEHFLKYHPNLILVNNIDYDHVDYFKTDIDYLNAFLKFIENSKDKVVVNGDDNNLKILKNTICFGIENKSMFYASNIRYDNGIDYDLYYQNNKLANIHLDSYGKYMVYNSLAALTCAICLGIDIKTAKSMIEKFVGVKRRFKETIINDDVYIDDYAHHPSKIKSVIEAIKMKYPKKKIIAFYRPDRASRLDYFANEFAKELSKANKAFILPFLEMNSLEKESIGKFIGQYQNIKLINDKIYKMVSKYKGVVYLMMSSKDISEVKENILKYKGD